MKSIDNWLRVDRTTVEFAKEFEFIKPNEEAIYFDNDKAVEHEWNKYFIDESKKELKAFITIAKEDEIVGRLFPFTSLTTLCFSRCIGYPYLADTPKVIPLIDQKDIYEVRSNYNSYLGIGNAEQVLKIVKENLPRGIRPAVKGTADDFIDKLK